MLSVKTPEEAYAVMEDAFPPRPGPEEAALSQAVVSSFMKADGILEIPQGTEGFPAGSRVQVRLLRPEEDLAREGLRSGAFRARLEALGGYRLEHSGPVRPNRPLPSPGSYHLQLCRPLGRDGPLPGRLRLCGNCDCVHDMADSVIKEAASLGAGWEE